MRVDHLGYVATLGRTGQSWASLTERLRNEIFFLLFVLSEDFDKLWSCLQEESVGSESASP